MMGDARDDVPAATPDPRTTENELDEPILPDDYPIFGDYLYVADGKVVRSDWHDITAHKFKRLIGANELRRCDIVGRRKRQTASRSDAERNAAQRVNQR